jgi:Tol biopolymer transport system component
MKDDDGLPQVWTVSPNGGEPIRVTRAAAGVASAFTWSPDGRRLAFVTDNRVAVADARTGELTLLTDHRGADERIRPEACVYSPDGRRVAFVVRHAVPDPGTNHIHVTTATA